MIPVSSKFSHLDQSDPLSASSGAVRNSNRVFTSQLRSVKIKFLRVDSVCRGRLKMRRMLVSSFSTRSASFLEMSRPEASCRKTLTDMTGRFSGAFNWLRSMISCGDILKAVKLSVAILASRGALFSSNSSVHPMRIGFGSIVFAQVWLL